jgi:hypothetical protein
VLDCLSVDETEDIMFKLIDNNGFTVTRGTKEKMLSFVKRQAAFDHSYALWLVSPNGKSERVL